MLTACDSLADIITGLDCGAEDYLTKPFSFLELAARIRALIRRGDPPPAVLHAGNLTLDAASRQVYLDHAPVHLTPAEFRLLEALMRHPGSVVERRSLVDAIWTGVNVADNSLDVTISALRAKIGPARKLIRTVRGFGYRIETASS